MAFQYLLDEWMEIAETTQDACNNNNDQLTRDRTLEKEATAQYFNPFTSFLPPGTSFYQYRGGLTIPPCSGPVLWNVADQTLSISVQQNETLVQLIGNYTDPDTCQQATVASPWTNYGTTRPLQDRNGRNIARIRPTFISKRKQAKIIYTAIVTLSVLFLFAVGLVVYQKRKNPLLRLWKQIQIYWTDMDKV